LWISNFGFAESLQETVNRGKGEWVKGKAEGETRKRKGLNDEKASRRLLLFVLAFAFTLYLPFFPVPLFPCSPFLSSGFSATFHAKLRKHSFSPGDKQQDPI
jgi:hypothetical protein